MFQNLPASCSAASVDEEDGEDVDHNFRLAIADKADCCKDRGQYNGLRSNLELFEEPEVLKASYDELPSYLAAVDESDHKKPTRYDAFPSEMALVNEADYEDTTRLPSVPTLSLPVTDSIRHVCMLVGGTTILPPFADNASGIFRRQHSPPPVG